MKSKRWRIKANLQKKVELGLHNIITFHIIFSLIYMLTFSNFNSYKFPELKILKILCKCDFLSDQVRKKGSFFLVRKLKLLEKLGSNYSF